MFYINPTFVITIISHSVLYNISSYCVLVYAYIARDIEYFIAEIRIFLRVIVIRRGSRATGASGRRRRRE